MPVRSLLPAVPGAFVLGATALVLAFAGPVTALAVPPSLVLFVLLIATVLAWRFRSTRIFAAALLLAAAHAAVSYLDVTVDSLLVLLLTTSLPLGCALLTLVADRGFVVARVRNHILLSLTPLVLAAFFSAADPARAVLWLQRDSSWSALPQPALLALVAALVIALARGLLARRAVTAGLTWTAVAAACAFAAAPRSTTQSVWLLAAAIVLVIAVVEAAYALAFYDELTELPARRSLAQTLSALRAPYTLAVVDVDHFKSFNDRYGHDVGDQVLRMVAARLRQVRGGGTAFRSGGEEFTLVFAGLSKREARPHVEALRAAIADAPFVVRQLPRPRGKRAAERRGRGSGRLPLGVTISVGVAGPTARHNTIDAVLKQADQAMYRAKRAGRNCVAV